MEAADTLCDSLFRWLENRKECAGELEKLAQELEDHQRSNTAQGVGADTIAHSSSGALCKRIFKRGLARTPLNAASATSTLVKAGVSSSTFNKATELIQKDEKVGTNIPKLLRDLKDRCGETQKDRCGGAPLRTHADELDCEVTTQLMWALARRRNTPVSLDFLRGFNRATFFRHLTPGGLAPAKATHLIFKALAYSGKIISSLKVLAKEMMKNIELIGIKAAKAGSEGATGLGISLCKLIVKSEEMVKRKKVMKASKFLRDSAREIREGRQKLKEELDAMQEIIHKLFRMKNLIENMGGYSLSMTEKAKNIMDYIMGTCTDKTVLSWLQGLTHQTEFVNLLQLCQEWLSHFLEDFSTPGGGHIHIVFVAHGRIVDQFMPSGVLVPTANITDTILYSPWNCSIDAKAAFAIAEGFIQVKDREFYNTKPIPLPDHWNSMRKSHHNIPVILLSPLTSKDGAWDLFNQLMLNRDVEIEDRVIIPYLVPKGLVNAFGEIPLYMLIFATSCILSVCGKSATVHLAACLGRKQSYPVEWERQYAYTKDAMVMTVNLRNMNMNMNSVLYRALRSLFDTNL